MYITHINTYICIHFSFSHPFSCVLELICAHHFPTLTWLDDIMLGLGHGGDVLKCGNWQEVFFFPPQTASLPGPLLICTLNFQVDCEFL